MATHGEFPPQETDLSIDLGCNYTSPEINVFAYRAHAHSLSRKVSLLLFNRSLYSKECE